MANLFAPYGVTHRQLINNHQVFLMVFKNSLVRFQWLLSYVPTILKEQFLRNINFSVFLLHSSNRT